MIIGHQKQWNYLKALAQNSSFPHAFLFSGASQLGKKTIAKKFIKLINCEKALSCQECRSCKDIEKNAFPDLLMIEPEKEITISQIRELERHLSFKPYNALVKTAIIDQAHLMNKEAQSALLKTLEEPKGATILILISEHSQALLPTILSRAEQLRFWPVTIQEIEKRLVSHGANPANAKRISAICQNKPGRAIELLQNPASLKQESIYVEQFNKLINDELSVRFQFAKQLSKDNPSIKPVLEAWLRHLRKTLYQYTQNIKIKRTVKMIKAIEKTLFLIPRTNVNSKLALEALMLEL